MKEKAVYEENRPRDKAGQIFNLLSDETETDLKIYSPQAPQAGLFPSLRVERGGASIASSG
jgi:hypothetical protein